jgi:hypothetical protein
VEFRPSAVGHAPAQAYSGHVVAGQRNDTVKAGDLAGREPEFLGGADRPSEEAGGVEEVDPIVRRRVDDSRVRAKVLERRRGGSMEEERWLN